MYLLLYAGPACLVAAFLFFAIGNTEAGELATLSWMALTFIGVIVKPRNIPEWIMTMANAALFSLAVVAALLGWI